MSCKHHLPRFRSACVIAGVVYVLVGAAVFVGGGATSMAKFGVPPETVASPHYRDAILWVYVHAIVLGTMIAVVGWFAQGAALQRWFARLMLVAHACYLFLDVRTSDSWLGNGLYQGPASVGPAVVVFCMLLLFIHPSVCNDPTP